MDGTIRAGILEIFGKNSFTDRILSQGCRASLKEISKHNRLIVDVDLYTRELVCTSKRCDYILFVQNNSSDKIICILIELKSGEYRVDDVVEKLQCTAQYLDNSLEWLVYLNPQSLHFACSAQSEFTHWCGCALKPERRFLPICAEIRAKRPKSDLFRPNF